MEDRQIVEELKEEQYSSGTTTRSSLTPTQQLSVRYM